MQNNKIEKIKLLQQRGICQTRFASIQVALSTFVGVPIGIGECKAVILRLNQYVRNSTNGVLQGAEAAYYGDAKLQEFELVRGIDSEIIFCNDLQEIFIRTAEPEGCTIQVLIYS